MKDHKYSINLGPWTGQGRRRRTMIYRIPNLEWKSHLNEPIKYRFNLALRAQKISASNISFAPELWARGIFICPELSAKNGT